MHSIQGDLYKKWIKNCVIDSSFLSVKQYDKFKLFRKVANVVADTTSRKTIIQFVPLIDKNEWNKKNELIYIFCIDDNIVKIGGTRNGLAARAASYLCGHHIAERGKSGKCSVTNAYIYNTLDYYIRNESKISMYAYNIPEVKVNVNILGDEMGILAQVYHAYEAKFLKLYKSIIGRYPVLNDNLDSSYL
jgi:hypothetical protein